jgi:hypothetical protein
MDGHPRGRVMVVSLCTSFTFTPRSPKEDLKTENLSVARVPTDREEHRSNDEQHGSENGEES